jgi:2-polyprenyl-3-methyl-5-hydroxy-6-metoxy-1,4-benzoquinol methylase
MPASMDSMASEKVSRVYWEGTHKQPRWRLPSKLDVGVGNILRLLSSHVQRGMRVLEIGCAPGKHLAYLAKVRGARVCGLDYSEPGIANSQELFQRLGLEAEFHCEDLHQSTFPERSFDVVYSLGVVEHFQNPKPAIESHLAMAKPGGVVLITVPNYGGLYGRIQRYFDPENLGIHNLDITSPAELRRLAPAEMLEDVEVFRSGRLSPWIINFEKQWPAPIARVVSRTLNVLGLLQPFEIGPLCPLILLKMTTRTTVPNNDVSRAKVGN